MHYDYNDKVDNSTIKKLTIISITSKKRLQKILITILSKI